MNNDLISREALKKELSKRLWFVNSPESDAQALKDIIDNAPTVSQTIITEFKGCDNCELERPHGEWLHPYITDIACECSNCHMQMPVPDYFKFCPNCGAAMYKPNCVTCDHFGNCEGCEKGEEE